MKKHRLLFLWLSLLLCAVGARAEDVQIGEGTNTDSYLPTYSFYNYSLTQQIYTAVEIGASGYINSIAFNSSKAITRSLDIYLLATDKEAFTNGSDWEATSGAEKVFSGTVDFEAGAWTTIYFDISYQYDGKSNLIVMVDDNTGSYISAPGFLCFDATASALRIYNDNTNYDPADPSIYTGTVLNVKNQIILNISDAPPISRPTDLNVTLTPGDGSRASLSWTENGTATEWEICLLDDMDNLITATTNPYELFPITPETTYTAKVRAVVGEERSEWSNTVTFTPTNAYQFTANDGTGTNGYVPIYGWYVDDISKSQFIIPAESLTDMLYGSIEKMTFYASQSSVDWGAAEFEVYITEVSNTTFASNTLVDWGSMEKVKNAGTLSISNNQMVVTLDSPYEYLGGNLMIGFLQTKRGSYSTSTWLGVSQTDNTALGGYSTSISAQAFLPKTTFNYTPGEAPACPKPKEITVVPGHDNATISWTGTSESYNLQYRPVAKGGPILTESFDEGLGSWTTIDADGDGHDWTQSSVLMSGYPISTHSGDDMVSSESYNSQSSEALTPDNYLVSPLVELGGRIEFYANAQDPSYPAEHFSVAVSTRSNDNPEDFTTIAEWTADGSTWPMFSANLSAYAGKEGYVAIRHFNCTDQFYLNIDDVTIYGPSDKEEEWITMTTEETSVELADLEMGTEYEYQVQGVCDGTPGDWTKVATFTTLDESTKIFVSDGFWNEDDNWFPVGVPTGTEDVVVKAIASIPSGFLAKAKTVTIEEGGSIIIYDGGQLKQGSDDVVVTLEKDITGYGENEGSYYLISTIDDSSIGTVSTEVEGLLEGTYGYYQFDSTQPLEWRSYDSEPFDMTGFKGYLYANDEDQTLRITGPVRASLLNGSGWTHTITYSTTSTDDYNGWYLIGNPYTCNAEVVYVNTGVSALQDATFYKLNANGDGFDIYENYTALAPGEAAFIKVEQTGKVFFLTDVFLGDGEGDVNLDDYVPVGTTLLPFLPKHEVTGDQDANLQLEDGSYDNSALLAELGGQKAPVVLKDRKLIRDTKWNTICLPFDVTLEGSVLEGAIVKPLDDVTVTDKHVSLSFGEAVSTIEAGVPYIIKWEEEGEDIVNPSFGWVTINAAKPEAQDFADGNVSFVGYYDAFDINPDDNSDVWYMKADNTLTHTAKPRTLKAFRTYFVLSEELSSGVNSFTIDFGDGETATGITEIADSSAPEGYFNLQGVKFDKAPKQKGVYIVNGKKVVVK